MASSPDALLGAAAENEELQTYAGVNNAKSGGGDAQDALMKQGAEMAGAAVATYFGLPPEVGAKIGGMLADEMTKEDEEKEKTPFEARSLGIGGG